MPRVGPTELIIVLVIVVIVFGIGRLPEVGGGLGKGIREFRRSLGGKNDGETGDGDDSDVGSSLGEGLREIRRSLSGDLLAEEKDDATASKKDKTGA